VKVSIAVPSRGYGAFIADCLNSIAMQTHRDFEVLIADGGSVDESIDIITGFTRRDARFRFVSRHDHGQADAVAKALAESAGDILCFLNADDFYLHGNVLATVVREFEQDRAAAVITGQGVYVDEAGAPIRPVRLRYHPFDKLQWMRWRTAVLQPATFWRRSVMQRVQWRTSSVYVFDAWFFYDAWRAGYPFKEIPAVLAAYRLHGRNKSLGISPDRIAELAKLEDHKFGTGSFRGRYLRAVHTVMTGIEKLPLGQRWLKRAVYVAINSASFASAYRLPSI